MMTWLTPQKMASADPCSASASRTGKEKQKSFPRLDLNQERPATVASSWIDMLAGLSQLLDPQNTALLLDERRAAGGIATSRPPAAANWGRPRFIVVCSPSLSPVRRDYDPANYAHFVIEAACAARGGPAGQHPRSC
jgi:hypothetical protein